MSADQIRKDNLQQLQALWNQWKEDAGSDENVIMTLDAPPRGSDREAPPQVPFFGIKPSIIQAEGITNTINPDSFYGQYPRDFEPLPLKCPILDAFGPDERQAVKYLWTGKNCKFRLVNFPTTANMKLYLLVTSSKFPEQLGIYIEDFPKTSRFQCDFGKDGFSIDYEANTFTFSTRDMFGMGAMKDLLGARVLHLFLRQYLWTIPWTMTENGFLAIRAEYIKSGLSLFEDSTFDLHLLNADAMHVLPFCGYSLDPVDCPGMPMIKVGEKLEKLGRFKSAAKLYTEIGQNYLQGRPREYMMYEFAGLAWRRSGLLNRAMENYVKALYLFGENNLEDNMWTDFNELWACSLITKVIHALFAINHDLFLPEKSESGTKTIVLESPVKSFTALSAMLSSVGFRPSTPEAVQLLDWDQGIFRTLLKPKYRSPSKSRRALIHAFHSGTVIEFTKRIHAVLQQDKSTVTVSPTGFADRERFNKVDHRIQARHDMKEHEIVYS